MNTHASNDNAAGHAAATAAPAPIKPRADDAQSLRVLLDDIESLLLDAGTLSVAEFERLRSAASARLAATGADLSDLGHRASREAVRQARRVDAGVHAQPWPAIGVGALLGLAVGVLISRKG